MDILVFNLDLLGNLTDTGRRMQRALFKRLPITHCSLSLLPFEDPVCSRDGIIFDLTYASGLLFLFSAFQI